MVNFISPYSVGTIVISQSARKLFLITGPESAIAYPVAVAKRGKEWSGFAKVDGKYVAPAWSPPEFVKRDHPELPDVIAGGSPAQSDGSRARSPLDRDEIAIHGTTPRCALRSARRPPTAASACVTKTSSTCSTG